MLIFRQKITRALILTSILLAFFSHAAYSQDIFGIHNEAPELLYLQGLLKQKEKQYQEALDCFDRVIEIDRQAEWAYIGKGECLLLLGEYGRAVEPFIKASSFLSNRVEAYLGLAESYEQQEAWDQARDAYKRIIEFDPELMGVHHNLGIIYFELEEWDMAMESFNKELEIDAYSPETYYMMGLMYSQTGEWEQMAEALRKAAQMPGVDDYDIYNSLSFAYRKLGQFQEAEKAYKKARYLKHNKLFQPK